MCGKLLKSIYGTRDAAQNWEEKYKEVHLEMGFKQGMASSCVFYHEKRKLRTVIHGDDFTTLGYDADLDWYREQVKRDWR